MEALAIAPETALAVDARPDFGELRARFFRFLEVSPKSAETYARGLRSLFRFFGENGIASPDRSSLLEWKESLKERGLAPATIQAYTIAARRFFSWTATEHAFPNIAEGIKGARVSRMHKKDYLPATSVKAVLASFDRSTEEGRREYALFALMVSCGLRDIEVSRANIEDLRPVGDFTALFVQGKGRSDRAEYVKIPEEVEAALRAYLRDREPVDGKEPLFVSRSGNSRGARLSTRSISGMIKRALTSCGYTSERLTAHSLRHTAITLSLLAGASIQEAQQFARHSNISTTTIYAHNLEAAANSCAAKVAASIYTA